MIPSLHSSANDASSYAPSSNARIISETLMGTIPSARLTEITGSAATTCLAQLVVETQQAGEPIAWITGASTTLHPPDLAAAGAHLASLAFVRINDETEGRVDRTKSLERLRAAEILLRSGGFGLVIVEAPRTSLPARALSRLHALARHHQARVVFRCAHQASASLGPLVGLRLEARREGERLLLETLKSKIGPVHGPTLRLALPDGAAPQQAQIELFPDLFSNPEPLRNVG